MKIRFEREVLATQSFEVDVDVPDTSHEPLTSISIFAKAFRATDPLEFDDRCFDTLEEAARDWFDQRAHLLPSELTEFGDQSPEEVRVYDLPEEEELADHD
jgi:hypothetical protein